MDTRTSSGILSYKEPLMALEPLKQFICDHCGTVIEKVEDGWLEWINDGKRPVHGFRIVHHLVASPLGGQDGCYYRDRLNVSDNHLEYYMGADGLVRLLAMYDKEHGYGVEDPAELAETIRRLHVRHHEEARRYIGRAIGDGFVSRLDCYTQSELEGIVKEYGEEFA